MSDDYERPAAECITELRRLLESLESLETEQPQATLLAYGWWVRVIRTADGVRLLHEAGLSNEASPLVRTLLHHVAALAWLAANPAEALEAVSYDHHYRRHRLGQKATERDWDLTGVELAVPPKKPKPPGLEYLDGVEKLCAAVRADHIYVAYVIESGYVHPSGVSSDSYLMRDEQGVAHLLRSPSVPGVSLRAAAVFAAVATRIMGDLIGNVRFTEIADDIGGRLGVPTEL